MQFTVTLNLDSPVFDRYDYANNLKYVFGFVAGQIDALTDHGKNMGRLANGGGLINTSAGQPLGRWDSERTVPPGETLHVVPDLNPHQH